MGVRNTFAELSFVERRRGRRPRRATLLAPLFQHFPVNDQKRTDQLRDIIASPLALFYFSLQDRVGRRLNGRCETPAGAIVETVKDGKPKRPRFVKAHIPFRERVRLAEKYGAEAGTDLRVRCSYCPLWGEIRWLRQPRSFYVVFAGLEIDHVVAESRGGGNTAENLQLTCSSCNRQKATRLLSSLPAETKPAVSEDGVTFQ